MRKGYHDLCKGWHTARRQMQDLLDMFAIMVIYEEAWEVEHPSAVAAARQTNCASAAIKLAQEQSRYPAVLSLPTVQIKKKTSTTKKKKVIISEQVQIKNNDDVSTSTMKLTGYRPHYLWYRAAPYYKPGDHASGKDNEYINTSQMGCTMADLCNLKVYVTDDEEAFDQLDDQLNSFNDGIGDHQGIIGLHELSDQIIEAVEDFMAQDAQQKDDMECLILNADRMVVLLDEEARGVLDFFLYDGVGEEDSEDDEESTGWYATFDRRGDWTCLQESLT